MFVKHSLIFGALCASLLIPFRTGLAAPSTDKFMGTGSCSSSNCHGNVNPIKGAEVLQNEYYTWSKHDRHSKAYANLLTPDAQRMAALLNLGDPTREPLCLKCHATYVPDKARQGAKFNIEDGVSCESCHGASERWLSSHTEGNATHASNIENGLRDLVPLDKRATLCLSCHYGDEDKSVTHDLYGAGHPRLSFELDTFGVLQPKHWVVDDEYSKRKGPYVPLAAWFIGQATHAHETVKAISSPTRSKNGQFPELSMFDCFSCHHSLTEDQWKSRTYGGEPGRLHLNLAPLITLQETFGAIDPAVAAELTTQVAALHSQYQANGATEAISILSTLLSSKVLPRLAKLEATPTVCQKTLRALAEYASKNPSPKYEVAEQIGMGMQAVLATSPELGKRYDSQLKAVFDALASSEAFKAEQFNTATTKLVAALQ